MNPDRSRHLKGNPRYFSVVFPVKAAYPHGDSIKPSGCCPPPHLPLFAVDHIFVHGAKQTKSEAPSAFKKTQPHNIEQDKDQNGPKRKGVDEGFYPGSARDRIRIKNPPQLQRFPLSLKDIRFHGGEPYLFFEPIGDTLSKRVVLNMFL